MTTSKVNEIREDPSNPRTISKDKFKKLVQSIRDFPEMLQARPIVVDPSYTILGGNMRYRACIEAGLQEVPVYVATWEESKNPRFIIQDNASYGEWDYDALANDWDATDLNEWGLDLWDQEEESEPQPKAQGIKIDFEDQDYDTALELVNALKGSDTYIGGIVLKALMEQFK